MVAGYYLIPFAYRWLWLLLGSYFFYMAHEPWLVILLLISTVVDYFCAPANRQDGLLAKEDVPGNQYTGQCGNADRIQIFVLYHGEYPGDPAFFRGGLPG